MKKILILLIIVMAICGCSSKDNKLADKLNKIISEDNYIIVDVRTPEEYKESHIKDAINISYDKIDEKVELDKNKTILVYCKSGTRSKIAYDILNKLGYDTYDLGAFSEIDMPKDNME